jgi:hypothetical protein
MLNVLFAHSVALTGDFGAYEVISGGTSKSNIKNALPPQVHFSVVGAPCP